MICTFTQNEIGSWSCWQNIFAQVYEIDRDGTGKGFNIALTRAIADAVSIPVIASGGVGTLEHLVEGIRDGHATAVLAASIFHFGTFKIGEAKSYMQAAGIPVRGSSV